MAFGRAADGLDMMMPERPAYQPSSMAMSSFIMTTTDSIPGRNITRCLGLVFGEVVSGMNAFKDIGASIRNFVGGRATGYEEELNNAREECVSEMRSRAALMGANAVVGVRFDVEYTGREGGIVMIMASGTAVQAE